MVDNILQIFEAVAFKKLDAEKEIDNWSRTFCKINVTGPKMCK